jgi:tRNA(fMet)-specific endonuclease VapC
MNTARSYGKIKNQLKVKGSPIPENDIWIAALADQYQLLLITRDKHFNNIEAISIETW